MHHFNDDFNRLVQELSYIRPLDDDAMAAARARQQKLVKPPGSLGRLEELSVHLAGITGRTVSSIEKPAVLIFSADNGVVSEGVASAPQHVTLSQTINFTEKLTGAGALSHTFGTDLFVTDIGINAVIPPELSATSTDNMLKGKILDRKIAFGTGNIRKEAAMSEEQALRALLTGIEVALAAASNGCDAVGIGEMGIGNTTTATALSCFMLDLDPEEVTGRGGGLTDRALSLKKQVIRESVDRARDSLDPHLPIYAAPATEDDKDQTSYRIEHLLKLISELGGFDIAAMTGAYLGAAAARIPAVIDGYISAVAALLAYLIEPLSHEFMIASHASSEPGYSTVINRLGLRPMLDLDMRLGEGSGCILAFQILKGAAGAMEHMATFSEASIDDSYLDELR